MKVNLSINKTIVYLFLFALSLRLGFHVFLENTYLFLNHPGSDVTYYQQWARDIAHGLIPDKVFWGLPLYPYFLGGLIRSGLESSFALRFIHFILGAMNCCLLYLVGNSIFSKRVGLAAAILTALSFSMVYYDWIMMPPPLIIFLTLIIILGLIHEERLNVRERIVLGLLIGLAALGDGKFLIFIGLFVLGKLFTLRNDPKTLVKKWMIIFLAALTIIFGCALRNRIVGGEWVLISAQSGLSFFVGNNAGASGVYEHPSFLRPDHRGQDEDQIILAEQMSGRPLSAKDVSAFWKNQATRDIANDPSGYLQLLIRKTRLFLTDTEKAYDVDLLLLKNWKQSLDWNPFRLILPMSLVGMVVAWRRREGRGKGVINVLILSQLIVTLVFFLTNRHRITILPLLILYQSYTLFWLADRIRERRWLPVVVTTGIIGSYLILFPIQRFPERDLQFLYHTKAGPVFDKRKEYRKAQEHYLKALALMPNDTNAMYNLGTSYMLSNEIKQARTLFERVLSFEPHQVDAIYNLAYSHEISQNFDLAVDLYHKLIRIKPDSWDAHVRLAIIYDQRFECGSVREHLQTIRKLVAENVVQEVMTGMKNCL